MSLDEIEVCVSMVMQHARLRGVTQVDSEKYDLYWKMLSDDWVDFTKDPKVASGSLFDDISGLRRLLADPLRASEVEIDRIASVLCLLSQVLQDSSGYFVDPDDQGLRVK